MTPQSKYEQARDEAAENDAKEIKRISNEGGGETVYSITEREKNSYISGFRAGADWHRDYSQKLNADLLADCKATKKALFEVADELERIVLMWEEQGKTPMARTVLEKHKNLITTKGEV